MKSRTSPETENLFARIDAMQMDELERDIAKTQLARASLLVEIVAEAYNALRGRLQRASAPKRPHREAPKAHA